MDLNLLPTILGSLACGLFFALVVGFIVGFLIVNARWEHKWKQQIQALAAQRGWNFRPSPDSRFDFILDGNEGNVPWELTYWRKRTVGNSRYTRMEYAAVWETNAASNERLLIYPRIPSLPLPIAGVCSKPHS